MPPSRPIKDRDTKEVRVLANRYEIVKKLGFGNCGTAFLCKDWKCGNEQKVLKEIAVGELHPDETFHVSQEAKLLSKLDHPGIVKFLDSFIDGEYFCIITEYCEGGDLDSKIDEYRKAGRAFDEEAVLNWTVQLLLAVQYIHSRRVLHRDLKARNIFIRNNLMKIGDFGISRILVNTADMASTFAGTPYYMSPEVLKHEGYNSKSDIWSIGCIIYELCSLNHAFMGQGLMSVMYKIVEGEPPDLPAKYSKELNQVFKKMLVKDPDKRPTAGEVLKYPYIAQHMSKMKDMLTDGRHNINPETADKEAHEIANYLREKSHLNDHMSTSEKPRAETVHRKQVTSQKPPGKEMTPRELRRLKKMQEADQRAQDLKKVTQVQFEENAMKREKIKTTFEKSNLPPWKDGSGGAGAAEKQSSRTKETSATKPSYTEHTASGGRTESSSYDDDDDEEEDTWSQTVVRRNSERDAGMNKNLGRERLTRSFSHATPRNVSGGNQARMNRTIGGTFPDERPITPMRDQMVYNSQHSSLDFEDGIPGTPEEANTFYEQFEDFDDDVLIGGETVRDDEEDLINHLEVALRRDSTKSAVVNDDTILGAYGPYAKETKIKKIRAECVKILGEDMFENAYKYLRNARSQEGGKEISEKKIMEGLRKYVKNPSDCFMVDQLLFLEEEAKLS